MSIITKNPEKYLKSKGLKKEPFCSIPEAFSLPDGKMLDSSQRHIDTDATLKKDSVTYRGNIEHKRYLEHSTPNEEGLILCTIGSIGSHPLGMFEVTTNAWEEILEAYKNAGYNIIKK